MPKNDINKAKKFKKVVSESSIMSRER